MSVRKDKNRRRYAARGLRRAVRLVLAAVLLTAVCFSSACLQSPETVVVSTSAPTSAPTATSAPTPTPTPDPTPSPAPTPEPSPEPTPDPTLAPDPMEARIASMSIKELIGQMVMIGIEGTVDIDEDSAAIMREYAVGNVMLFGRNTDTFAQTQVLTQRLQSYAQGGIPLAIGIDVEGGRVVRFIGQWEPRTNSALILGNKNDPQRVYDQYKQIGSKLAEIGININFAPVLDIAHTPEATFIGKRMFGSDPQAVSVLIREAIGGLHDGGVASLGKHFPGHGDTANDSHDTLPVINATLEQMERYELVPFEAAIDEGVDAILVGHLSYPNLDSRYVTSVSPKVITQLLRETMGFDGVVVSDDMRMQGIREEYTAGEGAVLHIQAGGDMVLIGRHASLQTDVLDSLAQAVEDGRLSRERLEQSVRRILLMKQQYAGFVP